MRVTGAGQVDAPAEAVWAALRDRALLARAIPGCERLDAAGAGSYRLTVTTSIAAVAGTYAGEATVSERREPDLVVAQLSAAGSRGTVRAEITIRLAPASQGATQVSYDVDAEVAGAIAGVGQRMLASIAKRLAGDFLLALGDLLAEPAGRPLGGPDRIGGPERLGGPAPESAVDRARRGIGLRGEPAAPADQPRIGARLAIASPGVKAGLLAGGAAGLAGILIGAVLGRRNRAAARGRR